MTFSGLWLPAHLATSCHIPSQHRALALVVKKAKAMTGTKGHETPLSMEGDSGDSGGWEALYQHAGLESGRPRQQPCVWVQPLVALPREALTILKKIHVGHTDGMLCRDLTELQHQHLDTQQERGILDLSRQCQSGPRTHPPSKCPLNTYYVPKSSLSCGDLIICWPLPSWRL